jgi:hypothetical protein
MGLPTENMKEQNWNELIRHRLEKQIREGICHIVWTTLEVVSVMLSLCTSHNETTIMTWWYYESVFLVPQY